MQKREMIFRILKKNKRQEDRFVVWAFLAAMTNSRSLRAEIGEGSLLHEV